MEKLYKAFMELKEEKVVPKVGERLDKFLDAEFIVGKYFMEEMGYRKNGYSGTTTSNNKFAPVDVFLYNNNTTHRIGIEVKARLINPKYTLEYFKKWGMSCEKSKLPRARKEYGINSFLLVTITYDNKILYSWVGDDTPTKHYIAPSTTCFGNQQSIDKEFFTIKDFQVADADYNLLAVIYRK